MPAYPVLLALIHPITGFKSCSIVLAQTVIGMGCILLGLVIGYLLRSRLVLETLVLFLGAKPRLLVERTPGDDRGSFSIYPARFLGDRADLPAEKN